LKFTLKETLFSLAFLILFSYFAAPLAHAGSATIWTDKADYGPEETVTIFGSGFLANTQVTVSITRPDLTVDTIYAVTNGSGAFTCSYQLDGIEGTYTVTATDGTNTATTTFADYGLTVRWVKSSGSAYPPEKNDFNTAEKVYAVINATGTGSKTVRIYIVANEKWDSADNGKSLTDVSGSYETVTIYSGLNGPFLIWQAPTTAGSYDIIVDVDRDGQFDYGGSGYDVVDDPSDSPGFTVTAPTVSITITSSPAGSGFVKVDDMPITTPKTYTWTVGSTYKLEALSPVSGGTGVQYVWTSWSDGGAQTHNYVVPSSSETVTAYYKTQYLVSFRQTGSAVAPTVDYRIDTGSTLTGTVPFDVWVDSGKQISFTYQAIVSGGSGVRYVLTGVSPTSPQTVTSPLTVTGTYKTQYQVMFTQTGLDATATGTVVTINGVSKTYGDLPLTDWFDSGTTYSYSSAISSTVTDKRFRLDSVTGPASPITGSGTVTGNYIPQYKVTFTQSGLDGTATGTVVTVAGAPKTYIELPFTTDWLDHGSSLAFEYSETVTSSVSGKRFKFLSASHTSPLTVTEPTTVTGNYKTQYQVTVTATPSGAVGGTFRVTYTQCGTTYTDVQKTTSWMDWVDAGTTVTVSEPQDIIGVSSDTRYKFDHYDPSDSVLMTEAKTITLVYKTQYVVYFTQTGAAVAPTVTYTADTDPVETVPFGVWVRAGSDITYTYKDIVPGGPGVRYVLTGVAPASPVTVNGPLTITGNYKTQYYLTVTSPYGIAGGENWYDKDATAYATLNTDMVDHGNGTRRVFTNWNGDASGTNYAQSNPIIMNGPKTAVANWKTQYLLTVLTDPAGLSPQPTRNPAGEAGPANGWWYDATTPVTLTAQTVSEYTFNYWDVDDASQGSGVNPISVDMDAQHTATAHYSLAPPSVSISPPSASIRVGQSVAFTSTASGGKPPYRYQWYLNGTPVSGATSSSWTFTPATTGTYLIYVKVTDQNDNTAQSATSTVKVGPAPPVGGYTTSFAKNVPTSQTAAYTALIAFSGLVLIVIRRKRK